MDLDNIAGFELSHDLGRHVRWKPSLPVVTAIKEKADCVQALGWAAGR
jgi:hypothetical protein